MFGEVAHFYFESFVDRQNCHKWSFENSPKIAEKKGIPNVSIFDVYYDLEDLLEFSF